MFAKADALESRLFIGYWDDGLLDLLAGVGLIGISVCWFMDLVAIGAVIPALVMPFWVILRRRLVEPRAGLVEFSDARTTRVRRFEMVAAVIGGALLLLFLAAYVLKASPGHALLTRLAPAVPAVLVAVMSTLVGLGLGLPRFIGYALLLVLAGLVVAGADAQPAVAMLAGGIVMLASGLWRLQRFLQLPVEHGEDGNVQ